MEDQILSIRTIIAQAKKQEYKSQHLTKMLHDSIPGLHNSIKLPSRNAVNALLDFVILYIEHVPDFIEAITVMTREAGVYEYSKTFLNIAQEYFLHPPEIITEHKGLDALMDEAYLAHRLMEEVNDRVISYCGAPLIPMDMTKANLVIHHLIGEPFANELDLAVQYTVEVLVDKENVFKESLFKNYVEKHKFYGWLDELNRWPCLTADLSVNLNFDTDIRPAITH